MKKSIEFYKLYFFALVISVAEMYYLPKIDKGILVKSEE